MMIAHRFHLYGNSSSAVKKCRGRYACPCVRALTSKPPEQPPRASSKLKGGPVTYLSLGIAAISGGAVLFYYTSEKEKKTQKVASAVVNVGKPALGGPWVLVDQDGIPRTDATYRGTYVLLYFGFTFCPDICPSELVKVGRVLKLLGQWYSLGLWRHNFASSLTLLIVLVAILEAEKQPGAPRVQPLFISVDPSRDTVGQIRHYRGDFHNDMIFLTGTPDQIKAATKAYRVYFSKANENELDDSDYLVDHSIVLYLVSPSGEFLDFFTQKMTPQDVTDKIMKHVKERQ
jgi:protein SCO1